ncbi:unnamed protein product [Blepharisma stoltei]|uniref:Tetratricopeptide repeat protein n=1 Tax=Blepharisma stoltei TaxID=1481888 RepID=A0AAU9IUH8_9CILI|nr:unnamed protein product [Blepharisma stoltei]
MVEPSMLLVKRRNTRINSADLQILERIERTIDSLIKQKRFLDCIEFVNKALPIRKSFYGENSNEVLSFLAQMLKLISKGAGLLVYKENPLEAIKILQNLLKISQPYHLKLIPESCSVLNTLACAYRHCGRYQKSLKFAHQALQIIKDYPDIDVDRSSLYLNLCTIYSNLNTHKDAAYYCKLAVQNAQEELVNLNSSKDTEDYKQKIKILGVAYHNLGVEEECLKHYESSIEWYKKSVSFMKSYADESQSQLLENFKKTYKAAVESQINREKTKKLNGKKNNYAFASARLDENMKIFGESESDLSPISPVRKGKNSKFHSSRNSMPNLMKFIRSSEPSPIYQSPRFSSRNLDLDDTGTLITKGDYSREYKETENDTDLRELEQLGLLDYSIDNKGKHSRKLESVGSISRSSKSDIKDLDKYTIPVHPSDSSIVIKSNDISIKHSENTLNIENSLNFKPIHTNELKLTEEIDQKNSQNTDSSRKFIVQLSEIKKNSESSRESLDIILPDPILPQRKTNEIEAIKQTINDKEDPKQTIIDKKEGKNKVSLLIKATTENKLALLLGEDAPMDNYEPSFGGINEEKVENNKKLTSKKEEKFLEEEKINSKDLQKKEKEKFLEEEKINRKDLKQNDSIEILRQFSLKKEIKRKDSEDRKISQQALPTSRNLLALISSRSIQSGTNSSIPTPSFSTKLKSTQSCTFRNEEEKPEKDFQKKNILESEQGGKNLIQNIRSKSSEIASRKIITERQNPVEIKTGAALPVSNRDLLALIKAKNPIMTYRKDEGLKNPETGPPALRKRTQKQGNNPIPENRQNISIAQTDRNIPIEPSKKSEIISQNKNPNPDPPSKEQFILEKISSIDGADYMITISKASQDDFIIKALSLSTQEVYTLTQKQPQNMKIDDFVKNLTIENGKLSLLYSDQDIAKITKIQNVFRRKKRQQSKNTEIPDEILIKGERHIQGQKYKISIMKTKSNITMGDSSKTKFIPGEYIRIMLNGLNEAPNPKPVTYSVSEVCELMDLWENSEVYEKKNEILVNVDIENSEVIIRKCSLVEPRLIYSTSRVLNNTFKYVLNFFDISYIDAFEDILIEAVADKKTPAIENVFSISRNELGKILEIDPQNVDKNFEHVADLIIIEGMREINICKRILKESAPTINISVNKEENFKKSSEGNTTRRSDENTTRRSDDSNVVRTNIRFTLRKSVKDERFGKGIKTLEKVAIGHIMRNLNTVLGRKADNAEPQLCVIQGKHIFVTIF